MEPNHGVTGRSQEPRRRFAEELKSLREQRGDSLRQLGAALGWDWSLFGKMEKGVTLGSVDVVEALDQYYGTSGVLLTLWELAVGDTPQFKARYRRYMKLEARATSIHQYSPSVVPGLFQTREYAHRMLVLGGTEPGKRLDQQVNARLSRRKLLTRDEAPKFRAILDESVLRRGLSDQAAWREQLTHLAEAATWWNVRVQVLPFSAGVREMSNTDTAFLRLPDGMTLTWVETGYGGELVEEAARVDELLQRYDQLRDHALSPHQSVEFVQRVLEETPCPPPPE
ncbi:helix-turn-helix domain-containing protein [Streptomyces sp. MUM 203J]|uniref:helix-turn-helix domain-containing protein n=1 Tax=Streptomyces sp. MUM 203J TaxID=2791990 RepID=UPI001F032E6A|nr:helix-turn-helix transcriptional regulator [Streptomyces sp. MUM 203J]MCH0542353.1 helix-turn-helix domain-containing protein [Streptomyces sp. MUM 203J]